MTFLITGLTCLFQIKVRLVMSGKAFLLELQSGSFTRLGGLVLTSQMCSNIVAIILIDMIEPMKITNISIHRAAGILWSLINTTLRILPFRKYLCFGCLILYWCFPQSSRFKKENSSGSTGSVYSGLDCSLTCYLHVQVFKS